jgi:hypothetical protein
MARDGLLLLRKEESWWTLPPWIRYSPSDYTLEQWYEACLIRPARNELRSKAQCKLPVKTPSGVLNKNAIFAAAAALAGARAPLQATKDEKTKAARTLVKLYEQMVQPVPESVRSLSDSSLAHYGVKGMARGESLTEISNRKFRYEPLFTLTKGLGMDSEPSANEAQRFSEELAHYGVKGMRWGVRKDRASSSGPSGPTRAQRRQARDAEILAARKTVQAYQVRSLRNELNFYKSLVTGGRKEAFRILRRDAKEFANSPELKIAQRRTTGEKWLLGAGAALFVVGATRPRR